MLASCLKNNVTKSVVAIKSNSSAHQASYSWKNMKASKE